MKRSIKITLYIVIALIAAGAIGAIIYYSWRLISNRLLREEVVPTPEGGATVTTTQEEVLRVLSDKSIQTYWLDAEGRITALTHEGGLIGVETAEDTTITTTTAFQEVFPSPSGKSIIAFSPSNKKELILESGKTFLLPGNISTVAWLNTIQNGDKFFALVKNNDSIDLKFFEVRQVVATSTASRNGKATSTATSTPSAPTLTLSSSTLIRGLNFEDVNMQSFVFTTSSFIYFADKPSFLHQGELWSLDLSSLALKKLNDGIGLMTNWDPTGSWNLQFMLIDNAPKLEIKRNSGQKLFDVPFVTLPEKCVPNTIMYCFIPLTIDTDSQLPDDYLQHKTYFIDALYRLDIIDSRFELVPIPNASVAIDATDVKLANGKLYFINRYDQRLYSLDLPQ